VKRARVPIARDEEGRGYPQIPPFHPSGAYPEYPFKTGYDPGNRVYGLVRDALIALGLDRENLETRAWNPLGAIVAPGSTVLVKHLLDSAQRVCDVEARVDCARLLREHREGRQDHNRALTALASLGVIATALGQGRP
jgi:hypothetical protein